MNIAIVGFGAMGQGITKLLLQKKSCQIVGVVDTNPNLSRKKVRHFLEDYQNDTLIEETFSTLFSKEIDLAIVTIGSTIESVYPVICEAIKNKINVITIAEEMVYPYVTNKELSESMHQLAIENNVTVLGTGINPGFVLDTLFIVLSSVSHHVDRIKAIRKNDLSPFGKTVLDSQGVGLKVDEFYQGVELGHIVGHVGFSQSIALLEKTFHWEIDEVIERKEPIVSKVDRALSDRLVKPGEVAGCNHTVIAKQNGEIKIELQHPQEVLPHLEGEETKDNVQIYGTPNLSLNIEPEIPGGIGTIAMAVNMIPLIEKSQKGLISMLDLPGLPSIFINQ